MGKRKKKTQEKLFPERAARSTARAAVQSRRRRQQLTSERFTPQEFSTPLSHIFHQHVPRDGNLSQRARHFFFYCFSLPALSFHQSILLFAVRWGLSRHLCWARFGAGFSVHRRGVMYSSRRGASTEQDTAHGLWTRGWETSGANFGITFWMLGVKMPSPNFNLTVDYIYATMVDLVSVQGIDYRFDDGKKKLLSWGNIFGSIAKLKTPGFQKCRSLTLSKHLLIRKLKKKKKRSCMDCQSPTPTSQNSLFVVTRSAD